MLDGIDLNKNIKYKYFLKIFFHMYKDMFIFLLILIFIMLIIYRHGVFTIKHGGRTIGPGKNEILQANLMIN